MLQLFPIFAPERITTNCQILVSSPTIISPMSASGCIRELLFRLVGVIAREGGVLDSINFRKYALIN